MQRPCRELDRKPSNSESLKIKLRVECIASGCSNTNFNSNEEFYPVPPIGTALRRKWLLSLYRLDLLKMSKLTERVCGRHFHSDSFYSHLDYKKVKLEAIPFTISKKSESHVKKRIRLDQNEQQEESVTIVDPLQIKRENPDVDPAEAMNSMFIIKEIEESQSVSVKEEPPEEDQVAAIKREPTTPPPMVRIEAFEVPKVKEETLEDPDECVEIKLEDQPVISVDSEEEMESEEMEATESHTKSMCNDCSEWMSANYTEYIAHHLQCHQNRFRFPPVHSCPDCKVRYLQPITLIRHLNHCRAFGANEGAVLVLHRLFQENIINMFAGDCDVCMSYVEAFDSYHNFPILETVVADAEKTQLPYEAVKISSRWVDVCKSFRNHLMIKHRKDNVSHLPEDCSGCQFWTRQMRSILATEDELEAFGCVFCALQMSTAQGFRKHIYDTHCGRDVGTKQGEDGDEMWRAKPPVKTYKRKKKEVPRLEKPRLEKPLIKVEINGEEFYVAVECDAKEDDETVEK